MDLEYHRESIEPLLVTVADACAALRIGRTFFWQLAKSGAISVVPLGPRATRAKVESIKALAARGLPREPAPREAGQ